jgi:hypothetical protein
MQQKKPYISRGFVSWKYQITINLILLIFFQILYLFFFSLLYYYNTNTQQYVCRSIHTISWSFCFEDSFVFFLKSYFLIFVIILFFSLLLYKIWQWRTTFLSSTKRLRFIIMCVCVFRLSYKHIMKYNISFSTISFFCVLCIYDSLNALKW